MAQTAIRELALEAIEPSPKNPRRGMEPAALDELTASVRAHGVRQPILVRPHPVTKRKFEVVFGHRRLEAARRAGLKTIPAMVEDLDDQAAAEARVTENVQRKDMPPLDEAEGFRQLHEEFHLPIEEIARRVGKPASLVRDRLALCRLPQEAKAALDEDRMFVGVAELIARIPNDELKEAAAKALSVPEGRERVSIPDARRIISEQFARRLKDAPFNQADAKLVPSAGSCVKCPKRTGNQRALFADIQHDDICTDPPCYARKLDAEWERRAAEAAAAGRPVATPEQAKEIFPHDPRFPAPGYVDLDDRCYTPGNAPLREALGDRADGIGIVVRDPAGGIRTVVRREEVDLLLEEKRTGKPTKTAAEREAELKRRQREEATRAAERELKNQVFRKASDQLREAMETRAESRILWLALALLLAETGDGYFEGELARRKVIRDAADLTPADLRLTLGRQPIALLRGMVCGWALEGMVLDTLAPVADLYGVDLEAIEASLRPKRKTAKERRAAGAKTRASASAVED